MTVLIILSTFLSITASKAQDSAWTLTYCIAYAKDHNLSLKLLKLDESSAQQDYLEAKANVLPTVTGSLSQTLTHSKSANVVVGGLSSQANSSGSYGVSSSITLYNSGYLKNDIKAKQISLHIASLSIQESENSMTLSITEDYLNILLAKENIKYLKSVLETSNNEYNIGKERYAKGSLSKKALLQLESQVASDQYSLISAENTYKTAVLTLKQLLQLSTDIVFEPVVPSTLQEASLLLPLNEAKQTALASRPEIQEKLKSIDLAKVTLDKEKASARPTITLSAGLSSGYSDNDTRHYFAQINNNFEQQLSLSMSIPIFSKRTVKTSIEKAKISINEAKVNLESAKTTLTQSIETAYINCLNAQSSYTAAKIELRVAKETFDICESQFINGGLDLLDLQTQKTKYINAFQSELQAKYSMIFYNKIYNFYTGVPVQL